MSEDLGHKIGLYHGNEPLTSFSGGLTRSGTRPIPNEEEGTLEEYIGKVGRYIIEAPKKLCSYIQRTLRKQTS